jgi:MFS family permease
LLKIVGSDEKKFGNAYGILNVFLGIGSWVGPYIAGFISDKSNMFITFCVTAAFLATAGVVSLISFTLLHKKPLKYN